MARPKKLPIPNRNSPRKTLVQAHELFARGFDLHQKGQLAEAQALYLQVLEFIPNHFDSLHLSAVIFAQRKNYLRASELLAKAIAINPNNATAYENHGIVLRELEHLDEALQCYDKAIALKADYSKAYYNRGIVLKELKRLDEALQSYDTAIALKANYAEAYYNRGLVLKELKQLDAALQSYDKAIALNANDADAYNTRGIVLKELNQLDAARRSYERAIALKGDFAEAYNNRGIVLKELGELDAALQSYDKAIELKGDFTEAYNNRGNALRVRNRLETAMQSFDKAIELNPNYAVAYNNRGLVLRKLKQFDAALQSCEKALALNADYIEAHINRGNVLKDLKQLDAALRCYDKAIELNPDYAVAYNNRGNVLKELKELNAAVQSFDRAIALDADYAEAYWNKSIALLLSGNLDKGWEFYEWRWKRKEDGLTPKSVPQPLWLGQESLDEKTILLHAEQGLGDTIQFCRYAKLVSALGARVVMEVPNPLLGLLKELEGVTELVDAGMSLPAFDYHCPLLSLPLAFRTNITNIPSEQAYLRSDPIKMARWAARLGTRTTLRIGVVWNGSTGHKNDHNRSVALSELITQLPRDFDYVSLQKEVRDIDQEALRSHGCIRHFGDELKDFTDTAALCDLMDVVISVDTSVAHLAGALGKSVWVLLPYVPDWRWLLNRSDSPWYPTAKLYRQEHIGDWCGVLEQVRGDLTRFSAQ